MLIVAAYAALSALAQLAEAARVIDCARTLWARQGWQAWPACAAELGLR
jgi:hypothetical protein